MYSYITPGRDGLSSGIMYAPRPGEPDRILPQAALTLASTVRMLISSWGTRRDVPAVPINGSCERTPDGSPLLPDYRIEFTKPNHSPS
jgi:hypothetical protein